MDVNRFFEQPVGRVLVPRYTNDGLPHWAHPILIGDTVYADTRPFLNNAGAVKNRLEYTMLVERSVLEYVWQKEPERFERFIPDLAVIFSEWVAGGISSRYNASEVDRMRFRIIFATYYIWLMLSQGTDGSNRPVAIDELKTTTLKILSRVAAVPATYADTVLSDLESTPFFQQPTPTLMGASSAIVDTATLTMGRFDHTTVLQLMGAGSWMGHNAVMLSAMALEYPPLFAVLIKHGYEISTYRNKTRIGRAVNSVGRKIDPKAISKAIDNLVIEFGELPRPVRVNP